MRMLHAKQMIAALTLGMAWVLFGACGGRSVISEGSGTGGFAHAGSASGVAGLAAGGASSTCDGAVCLAIGCGEGSVSVLEPGACCPICVAQDPAAACALGKQTYAEIRRQVIQKYGSAFCSSDSDCAMFVENNACAFNCGTPMPKNVLVDAEQALTNFADLHCSTCPPGLIPPCFPAAPYCWANQCVQEAPPPR